MGLIFAGIIISVLICYVAMKIDVMSEGLVVIVTVIVFLGIFSGITGGLLPDSFDEPEIHSITELVSLSDQTISAGRGLFYISITGTNSYSFYVEVENTYGDSSSRAYRNQTITGKDVTIVENDEFAEGKLVIYKFLPKKDFWSFRCWQVPKYEYVFYVPTGTITRDIQLG